MDINILKGIYENHQNTKEILKKIISKDKEYLHLKALSESSISLFLAFFFEKTKKNNLIILSGKEEAAYFYNDIVNIIGDKNILFFPSSYKHSIKRGLSDKIENENLILRTEVLNSFVKKDKKSIIISYPASLIEKVISVKELKNNILQLKTNENLGLEFVEEILIEYKFEKVDFVYKAGQYSRRGNLIDIFSFSNDYPYRINFIGDKIENIKIFDTKTQLSKSQLNEIAIIPNVKNMENQISFFEFIPKETILWTKDLKSNYKKIDEIYKNTLEKSKNILQKNLLEKNIFFENLKKFKKIIEFGEKNFFSESELFNFNISKQKKFNKNFEIFKEEMFKKTEENYTNIILSNNEKQIERINKILEKDKDLIKFKIIKTILHGGFIDNDLKISLFTDHQIFDRYHKFELKNNQQIENKQNLSLKEINNLNSGDYVVHIDYGVARFSGLETQILNGKKQESIRLVYKNNDILLVSIHSLHKISKYKSKDSIPPKIHKLGSKTWKNLKTKTKKKIKDIAKKLINLYAKRQEEKGYSFSKDTYLSKFLEASFIYEDTPDQLKTTIAVKNDMEKPKIMDRLVCGDVGFGKTEIAIRAAFKAVVDNKQVALLVPTTILAFQHFRTFTKRLEKFPCNIDYISRMRNAKETKKILQNLKNGDIDILIGTHRLVSKDVKFKDLGLLIIDEEQKFGVSIKEKLKAFKLNVDTLTLTATPIPRTLQFSLIGARDLSIINTAPPNRYPIITELHNFDEEVIKEAINYEVQRNGQVFFINNRIDNIFEIQKLLFRILPDVKTVVAHGRLDGKIMEKVMLDFINEDYDILIATSIIENGLDIPNANTIIINNAQNFGLSDLHQLRGRVGRSNKKAFCYLITPPKKTINKEALRRLKAIEEFSELGSGFNISLQDMDIRGAGNILGGEQSGFISDMGFQTYQRILKEAVLELRENEFSDFYKKHKKDNLGKDIKYVNDCQIDTDLELFFPENYIESISERMHLYRKLDNMEDEKSLKIFENQLIDRFGKLPKQSRELINVVFMRFYAINLGMEKIIIKNKKMVIYLVSNKNSPFYESQIFQNILVFLQKNPKICQIKEKKDKMFISIENVNNIEKAIFILNKI